MKRMTTEEVLERLKAAGLDPNRPMWVKSPTVDLGDLGVIQRQREILTTLRGALAQRLEEDRTELANLRDTVAMSKGNRG